MNVHYNTTVCYNLEVYNYYNRKLPGWKIAFLINLYTIFGFKLKNKI